MIVSTVMYQNQPDATFDMAYYCNRHIQLVRRLLGDVLKGVAVERGVGSANSPAPYVAMGRLWFDSVETFQAALAAHGPALIADIPNYTNTKFTIQVSEIELAEEPSAKAAR